MWTARAHRGARRTCSSSSASRILEPVFLVSSGWRSARGAARRWRAQRRRAGAAARRAGGRWRCSRAMQVAVPFVLLTYGEDHISSSLTGILVAASPIFTALLVTAGRRPGGADRAVGAGRHRRRDRRRRPAVRRRPDRLGLRRRWAARWSWARRSATRSARSTCAGACSASRPIGVAAATMTISALMVLPIALFQLPTDVPVVQGRARRADARAARHRRRVLDLLHADHRGRGGQGVGRRLPGAGLRGRLRGDLPGRAGHGRARSAGWC